MKRSNRLVLLIGIFLAIVAFVLILITVGGNKTQGPAAAPTTTSYVVAVNNIALGATIQAGDVREDQIAIGDFPANGFHLKSLVIGQVARSSVTAEQAITTAVLSGASGSIQNIEVPAGYVAMSVQVDQITGVGTIIKPGDFVDLVTGITTAQNVPLVVPQISPTPAPGTFIYNKVSDDFYNHTTVKILAQGLQVLGTLLPPPPASTGVQNPGPSAGPATSLNGQQQIVILAVRAQDAEVLKFSEMDGDISLVLRSSADCTTKPAEGEPACPVIKTTGITLRRLIEDRGVLPPQVVQVIEPTPYPGTSH